MRSGALFLALLALGPAPGAAPAQEPDELCLALRRKIRDRGGDRIQGRFTLEAAGLAGEQLRRSIEDAKHLD